jgi:hypothetical protein
MTLKITFVKTGTNDDKALTGDLTLLDDETVVKESTAFSGGSIFNPIDDGKYRLRLDIRGDEDSCKAAADGTLKPFYGIQRVGTHVRDDQGNDAGNGQSEWGSIRARLNPTGGAPDHGDYIHGKLLKKNFTHGCVCDKSEVILTYLWNLDSPPVGIDVIVSGGQNFDLETLVRKNPIKKLSLNTKARRLTRKPKPR